MGGTAPDAWVFTRYAADRFPGQKRRYIWFVSAGLAGDIPDPRTEADPRGGATSGRSRPTSTTSR